jgi:LysM repeat protein
MADNNIQALNENEIAQVSGGTYNGPVFVYVMKPGDTLDSVAAQYGTTVAILAELNNINNPAIPITGQKIYVPSKF